MKLDDPDAYFTATELEIIERMLSLRGAEVLELGCGKAETTRRLAERFHPAEVVATEVDSVQHAKNLAIDDLPGVRFVYGGAERIDLPDAGMDAVLMLKSLHHVPVESMDAAMREIHRVLRPGGLLYVSEPVYAGELNDIMRLFHDEEVVRQAAFDALCTAVNSGMFTAVDEIFHHSPTHYADFADFEQRILKVTHTRHAIDETLYREIKIAFDRHLGDDGAHFLQPARVDLLRKV